ncbi:MAG: DUF4832 domain-containing protein [Clostridia bacterium]|nr:DUF4832 domain-containing protein [Clostridia bacterium]
MKKTLTFNPTDELLYNPYIGVVSFQHFRGEKLYSDCIAGKPGTAGCETENYECYPVPDGVEENGREQGYFPDTTVCYIRILWKEFEPIQGVYNYDFIQEILDKAKEKGQTVMFRLMPHSTCARDDVPNWLKKLMPCPERPDGMRVKDSPSDPRYLKLFGLAIEKLGERFDSNPTLDCVDISLGGAWGEGAQAFPEEELKALMDIYVRVFKNTKLLGQMGNAKMLHYIGEKRPIGWRGDGTGQPHHMDVIFPNSVAKQEKEFWKTAPVSFESYWWVSEWDRQGWDIDSIIEKTLGWHLSTFNTKSFPIPLKWKEKIEFWIKKMGYRFCFTKISIDESVNKKDLLNIDFTLNNLGVAPIYNKLPLSIILKGDNEYVLKTDVDITKWLPGENNEFLKLKLPNDIKNGVYKIYFKIGGEEFPVVKMAMDTKIYNDAYFVGETKII